MPPGIYMMLVGHFLLESFKKDVSVPVLSIGSYASTVRRRLIDIAGKIVFHSGETILKVSRACLENLRLPELFIESVLNSAGDRLTGTKNTNLA